MTSRFFIVGVCMFLAGTVGLAHGEPAKVDSAPPVSASQSAASQDAAATTGADVDVSDLPVHEVLEGKASTDMLGLLITGDGGWWTLDNAVGQFFAARGVPIAGISSFKYFGTPRTPDVTAADMVRVLRHYLGVWKKERIVLIGYSLGAEIVPFVASRLPEDLRKRTVMTIMIAPAANTYFEFHTKDWLVSPSNRTSYPVQPEIERIAGIKLLCITGDQDDTCICDKLDAKRVQVIRRSGTHHFKGDYKGLAQAMWDALEKAATVPQEKSSAPSASR